MGGFRRRNACTLGNNRSDEVKQWNTVQLKRQLRAGGTRGLDLSLVSQPVKKACLCLVGGDTVL